MSKKPEMVEIDSIITPSHSKRQVNAEKYQATKTAILKVLPNQEPGLTFEQMRKAACEYLPEDLFPNGKTSGWWCKTVQLDLEAKNQLLRINSKPLRFIQTI